MLINFINHPRAFTYLFFIGLALVSPSLLSGFFADDYSMAFIISNPGLVPQPDNLSPWNLFTFLSTDTYRTEQLQGVSAIPWWVSPDFSVAFWRPFSELLHFIDYQFFYDYPFIMHLHSLIWYGLLLGVVAKSYITFIPSRPLAALAFLFFVVDSTHGFTVAWLSNRNALLAAFFSFSALLAHHQFRSLGNPFYIILALIATTISFLSAEIGICTGVLLLGYALFYDKKAPSLHGLIWLLPYFLIFCAWLIVYRHYGYGAHGNKSYYVDLFSSPLLFLEQLIYRLPAYLTIQFNLFPTHLLIESQAFMAFAGFSVLGVLVYMAKHIARKPYFFLLFVLLLCIIPISSSEVQDRNALYLNFAGAGLLAYLTHALLIMTDRRWLVNLCLYPILIGHILFSALLMIPMSYAPAVLSENARSIAAQFPDDIKDAHIVTLGIPLFDGAYIGAIRAYENLSLPARFWNITTQDSDISVMKVDDHTYTVQSPAGLLDGIDFMLRDKSISPMVVGETHKLNGLDITITGLTEDYAPSSLLLNFNENIQPRFFIQLQGDTTEVQLEAGKVYEF